MRRREAAMGAAIGLVGIGGAALVVSQFTHYADTRKGRRPSFTGAALPETARPLVARFAELLQAQGLVSAGVRPEHDLVFAAVAQEETGLVGMTKQYAAYQDRAIGFVDVLGDGRSISYGAIGIHWWKVIARGPAGHSLSGGLPNVNQGIGRAVDRILALPQPEAHRDDRTVINISIVASGAVFNHKPESGWFSLDIRSLESRVLDGIETDVRRILEQVTKETSITFTMEPFQMTPGGQLPGARDSCGCFEAVAFYIPEVEGFGIVDRGYRDVTVNGLPFSTMADSTAGGRQVDGFHGISIEYMRSSKFLQADGGYSRVVWMPKDLKERLRAFSGGGPGPHRHRGGSNDGP